MHGISELRVRLARWLRRHCFAKSETNVQGGRVQREWCCCMVSLGVVALARAMCVGMFSLFTAKW